MFIFEKFYIEDKKIYFHYKNNEFDFVDTISLDNIDYDKNIEQKIGFKKILFFLHILLGISYYKINCPKQIIIKSGELNKSQADFFNNLYTKGLGEFFYKNKIDFRGLVNFPFEKKSSFDQKENLELEENVLVPFGGGKDSISQICIFEKNNIDFELFTLGNYEIQNSIAKKIGKKINIVERKIDEKIFEINKSPKYFNGHIPISSIYSATGLLICYIKKIKYLSLANANSSDFGNLEYLGSQINHQYSKSFEMEKNLNLFIKENIGEFEYFSFIRPISEIKVGKIFGELGEKYFDLFSSCNKNFRILKKSEKLWCCKCPKCAYVFLLLACFIDMQKLISIFGENLLERKDLLNVYQELVGFSWFKPFDCVGDSEEVKVIFNFLISKFGKNYFILEKIGIQKTNKNLDYFLDYFGENIIPENFLNILKKDL